MKIGEGELCKPDPGIREGRFDFLFPITTTHAVRSGIDLAPFGFDPFGGVGPFGGKRRGDALRREKALGSGFIIDKGGYVVTNAHVVEDADDVRVVLADDREFRAKVRGRDRTVDLAVLKLEGAKDLPTAVLGSSDALKVGEYVVAIGNPFGLGHTVTMGIVSAKGRAIGAGPYDDFIQTDASINPGNSGGPLFNLRGEVVGINTAINRAGRGIGFAAPVDTLKLVLDDLKTTGHVERARLGVAFQHVDAALASAMGLDRPRGALVAEVDRSGPAAKAGIREGDVITAINGAEIGEEPMLHRNLGWLLVVASVALISCKKEEVDTSTKSDKSDKSDDDDGKKKKKKADDSEDKGDDDKPAKKKKGDACPDSFTGFKDYATADEQTCTCDAEHAGGAVWGTGIYTEDSNPCAAAVHVGVIKREDGGSITMKHTKGCKSYVGSKANAVNSSGWGAFGGSFYFPDKGDGKCAKDIACPGTFKEIKGLNDETEITCTCAENPTGSVWGSDPYTQDSSICAAAQHGGVITKSGGSVTAKASPGCSKYEGTAGNGITTAGWGPYETSFYFPSKGTGICKSSKTVTAAKWKVGDAVDTNWNGAWYQSNIIAVAPNDKYRVHYVGYASSWDEWVGLSRLRARTGGSLKGSK